MLAQGCCHLSGWAGSGRAPRRAVAAAATGTALRGTPKVLREGRRTAIRASSSGSCQSPLPLGPPLTSELLARAIGRLRGAVVRRGLSGPIGTAGAALELAVLWGPCESRR